MNLIERYFNEDPELTQIPLPEIIIQSLGGKMDFIDPENGRRLYAVRDWVHIVSGSTAKQKHIAWRNLKKSIEGEGDFELSH